MGYVCPNCASSDTVYDSKLGLICKYCQTCIPTDATSFDAQIEELVFKRNSGDLKGAASLLDKLYEKPQNKTNYHLLFQDILTSFGVVYVENYINENEIERLPVFYKPEFPFKSIFDHPQFKNLQKGKNGEFAPYVDNYINKLTKIDSLLQLIEKNKNSKNRQVYDVFISYKGGAAHIEDERRARDWYDVLTNQGYNVFFAPKSIEKGEEWEPQIYNALYTAKVLILICATKGADKSTYLQSPWVASEWRRFLNRRNDTNDNVVIISISFNGFTASELPNDLNGIQMFDSNTPGNTDEVLSKVKQYVQRNVSYTKINEQKIEKVELPKEEIRKISFANSRSVAFKPSEQSLYETAVGLMEQHQFAKAKRRLDDIVTTNSNNYLANLAKLKCDFSLQVKDDISSQHFHDMKHVEIVTIDFLSAVAVAGDDFARLVDSFGNILFNTFKDDPFLYVKILLLPEDKNPYLILLGLLSTHIPTMINYVDGFGAQFYKFVMSYPNKEKEISTLITKHFRIAYSNDPEHSSVKIGVLYRTTAMTLLDTNIELAREYINEALKVVTAHTFLMERFVLYTYDSKRLKDYDLFPRKNDGALNETYLYSVLSKKYYREFDISDKFPDEKDNYDNLFYVLMRCAQLGFGDEVIETYGHHLFNACVGLIMEKKTSSVALAKKLVNVLTTTQGMLLSNEQVVQIIQCFIAIGDFEEASKYIQRMYGIESSEGLSPSLSFKLRWQAIMVEARLKSNFDFLNYKKDLYDLKSFMEANDFFFKLYPNPSDKSKNIFINTANSISKLGKMNNLHKLLKKAYCRCYAYVNTYGDIYTFIELLKDGMHLVELAKRVKISEKFSNKADHLTANILNKNNEVGEIVKKPPVEKARVASAIFVGLSLASMVLSLAFAQWMLLAVNLVMVLVWSAVFGHLDDYRRINNVYKGLTIFLFDFLTIAGLIGLMFACNNKNMLGTMNTYFLNYFHDRGEISLDTYKAMQLTYVIANGIAAIWTVIYTFVWSFKIRNKQVTSLLTPLIAVGGFLVLLSITSIILSPMYIKAIIEKPEFIRGYYILTVVALGAMVGYDILLSLISDKITYSRY